MFSLLLGSHPVVLRCCTHATTYIHVTTVSTTAHQRKHVYPRTHDVLHGLNEKRVAANTAPAVSALIATQDIIADVYLSLCCFNLGHIYSSKLPC